MSLTTLDIDKKIGEGGASVVYTLKGDSTKVAKISKNYTHSPQWAERNEDSIVSRLKEDLRVSKYLEDEGISIVPHIGASRISAASFNAFLGNFSECDPLALIMNNQEGELIKTIPCFSETHPKAFRLLVKEGMRVRSLERDVHIQGDLQGIYSSKGTIHLIDLDTYSMGEKKGLRKRISDTFHFGWEQISKY